MHITLLADGAEIVVARLDYPLPTLHKCFYWYTRDYQVQITEETEQTRILLQAKDAGANLAELPAQIHNDLLDFHLRDLISQETRPVRELLLAKAFAHYIPEQPLEEFPISDPVGFHPLSAN